jgi:NTE family protein
MSNQPKIKIGIVLSGGGARGAYQAGVLKAIGQICQVRDLRWPFHILTGLSSGAINSTYLASSKSDFYETTNILSEIWSDISADDVFRTDPASLSLIGARWISAIATGGVALSKKPQSLVDTSPLRRLVTRYLDSEVIEKNIQSGKFDAVCVSATDYATSRGISFVQGKDPIPLWNGPRSYAVGQNLRVDHILASSAIPLLFPAVKIGNRHYGDGCLRNLTPLNPAIRLGADKIFIVGVRRELGNDEHVMPGKEGASAGRIFSVLLNAVLMDGLESDIDKLQSINHLIANYGCPLEEMREIPFFMLRPSKDIAEIAVEFALTIPPFVRYLTHGLGSFQQTAELISYLLFEPSFCSALIDLGYNDAMTEASKISKFLHYE